jgi:hypothetical protein
MTMTTIVMSTSTKTKTMTERHARRGHAAIGGRIVAAGLSTGAAIVFAATIADAARNDAAQDTGSGTEPAGIVVHVVMPDGRTVDSTVAAVDAAPTPVLAAAPAPAKTNARSRAS